METIIIPAKDTARTGPLWASYKDHKDPAAREELILIYAPLVKFVAGRLAISLPPNVEREDLISYGVFGLMDAIEKFDLARGLKFETYAIARIRGSMLDGLRAMDWVPVSVRQKTRELEKTYATLSQRLGREATDEEVAQALGLTLNEFAKLLQDVQATTIMSLDEYWLTDSDKGDPVRLIDSLADEQVEEPTAALEFEETRLLLAQAIDKLPEKERTVIALYYYEGLTLKEIGAVIGVSESRISQLHTKAILRLRGQLARQKKKIF
ncbi:RNA polymerase sigma factor, flia/whig family [Heliomicrobium modesticaldum Ice1]|uniref:RNA polymerase sigma factor n=1 Tax=Heliobacterium modesticaldum (strain ATCC 51547 / Ice1) TaxID=498761 RepID=B0THD2_HELMI|nr:RNA polymerase sigma factor, flia/whig family [Heliomicrobium modesticaldum Ice1]